MCVFSQSNSMAYLQYQESHQYIKKIYCTGTGPTRLRIYERISSGTLSSARASNSSNSSSHFIPSVKFKSLLFFKEYFRICNSSISSGDIRFLRSVIVSLPDENTLSHGTLEA